MKGKKMRHFEYKDLTENASKFWKINLESKKLIVTYGRIGIKKPAIKTYIFPTTNPKKGFKTKEDAKKFCEKKIREKTNKGYQEIN